MAQVAFMPRVESAKADALTQARREDTASESAVGTCPAGRHQAEQERKARGFDRLPAAIADGSR